MVGNRKAELISHSILKHITASILVKEGHKCGIEIEFFGLGIVDVIDWTDGIVYEIQPKKNRSAEADKVKRYTSNAEVKDVIFIYYRDYPLNMTVSTLYKKLKRKLVGEE